MMTMTISASPALPTAPVAATPNEASSPNAAPAEHHFAKLLKQNRPDPAAHAAHAASQQATAKAEKSDQADQTHKGDKGDKIDKSDQSERSSDRAVEPNDKNDETRTDPALADWLAGLQLPDPSPPALPNAATATDASAQGTDKPGTDAAASLALAGHAAQADSARNAADASRSATEYADESARDVVHDIAQAADRESSRVAAGTTPTASVASQDSRAAPLGSNDSVSAAAPVWTAVSSTATTPHPRPEIGRDAAHPAPVNLAVPVTSPEFPQAMGVQLTVLAKSGIEHAELHLNPAEMGPVSVQIVVDGTQARIEFGADVAATRHAIETGLPGLAGALREAGLTLTGGGVSQHSRGRQDGANTSAGGGAGLNKIDALGTADAAPLRRFVAAGGVDLYA